MKILEKCIILLIKTRRYTRGFLKRSEPVTLIRCYNNLREKIEKRKDLAENNNSDIEDKNKNRKKCREKLAGSICTKGMSHLAD